jgi:hypothetical protein
MYEYEVKQSYKRWLKTDNGRAYKAKQMRYKKAAMSMINKENVYEELYEIMNECDEIRYFISDDESLVEAMNDDEEEAYEFRMLFMDLSAKCETLECTMRDNYVTEHFDDFLVGILGNRFKMIGYDEYEEDYFNLTLFEAGLAQTESGKRVMRLTKEQMLEVCGQCLGIVISFLDIRHKYDYLKASFDILKNKNSSILQTIKGIEELYEKAVEDSFCGEHDKLFNMYVSGLPDEVWLSA